MYLNSTRLRRRLYRHRMRVVIPLIGAAVLDRLLRRLNDRHDHLDQGCRRRRRRFTPSNLGSIFVDRALIS